MAAQNLLERQYFDALHELSPLRRKFVENYLLDFNGRKAALAAGYSSRPDAAVNHCLKDPKVRNALRYGEELKNQLGLLKVRLVLNELAYLVHSDVRNFRVNKHNKLVLRRGALPHAWRSVASQKIRTKRYKTRDGREVQETEFEIRLWDKNAAIEKAMRHLGLLRNDVHVHDSALEKFLKERAAGLHAATIQVMAESLGPADGDGGSAEPPPSGSSSIPTPAGQIPSRIPPHLDRSINKFAPINPVPNYRNPDRQ